MDCRKPCGCHNNDSASGKREIFAVHRMVSAMALWDRVKTMLREERNSQASFWAILLRPLRAGIAEIALVKSLRQFGREEEKE